MGMSQSNLDMSVFLDTNITGRVYTCKSDGYRVVTMDAPSRHRGVVAVLYWPSPQYLVKAIQKFGPNVVVFQLVTEEWRWYIIGCYLAPNNILTIESVVAAIRESPRGSELLVVGYFNTDLAHP